MQSNTFKHLVGGVMFSALLLPPHALVLAEQIRDTGTQSKNLNVLSNLEEKYPELSSEELELVGQFELDSLSIDPNKWLNSYEYESHLPQFHNVSGAFTHDFKIVTPPGRAKIEPNLVLTYNSQDKRNDNIFGFGWSINIPYIERINKNGLNNLYTNNYFTSSLDGELATTSGSSNTIFGAKFEQGNFRQYTFSTSTQTWTAIDKNGIQYIFGSSTSARIYDPNDSSHTAKWMLEKIQDTNGNSMSYSYNKYDNQIYPYKITYTANGTTSAPFEVEFITENRTDITSSYSYGFSATTTKRIESIDIKFNGTSVNEYFFEYTTGSNSRSLLYSIVQVGYDESSNPTQLPPTTFAYQPMTSSWPTTTPLYDPPNLVDSSGKDLGYRLFHFRPNESMGLVRSDVLGTDDYSSPNWDPLSNSVPAMVDLDNNDLGVAIVDVNGDTYPDIVKSKEGDYREVYLRTGGGTFTSASTSMTNIPYMIDSDGNDYGTRFGDFNGDGYADYIQWRVGVSDGIFFNKGNGTGWASSTTSNLNLAFVGSNGEDYGTRVMDLNGDGLDDVIRRRSTGPLTSALIALNKGGGTSWENIEVLSTDPKAPPYITDFDGKDIGTRMTDINADGLVDFLVSSPSRGRFAYINLGDGHSFEQATVTIPYFLDASEKDIGTRIFDGNNDGIPDFVTSNPTTSVNNLSSGSPSDVLTTISLNTGGGMTITYRGSRTDSALIQVVDTVTSIPGLGGTEIAKSYSFGNGRFQSDYQNRKFAGFAIERVTDSIGTYTVTYYHQGNGNNTSDPNGGFLDSYAIGEYNDIEAKMFRPYRTEVYKNINDLDLFSTKITKWDSKDLGNGRTLVFAGNTLDLSYDGDSDHRDSAVTYDHATSTGNLISRVEWGEVTGSDNGTFSDTGTDKRTTVISYATSSSIGVKSLPETATTTDNSGNTVSITRNYYDNLALGLVDKGNLTKQDFWKFGTTYNSIQNTYNSYGLIATSTDARGKSTGYKYDSYFLYPATTTLPLNQTIQKYFDYSSGSAKKIIDQNGLVFQTDFDGLDRITAEKQPSTTTPSTLVTKNTYSYNDNFDLLKVHKISNLNDTTSAATVEYFDGLRRKIQERISTEDDSTYIVKDYVYDSRGLLQKESLPYFSTGSSRTSATTSISALVSYSYDALQRVSSTTNSVGTTLFTYDDWTSTTTDANGNQKKDYKDAFGNLIQVDEIGTTTNSTYYTWNGNNKLTKITDAAGNIRNFTYNGMGLLVDSEDLHASTDTTFGTWHNVYDNNGNLTQTTDPKGQIINYVYDDLNRRTSEDYTGTASVDVSYSYDSCTNGIGRLCTAKTLAQTANSTTTYAYDPLGNVAQEVKAINSSNFTTAYEYDRQGNLTLITHPDSTQVEYEYNAGGLLEKVSRKDLGSIWTYVIGDIDYAPTGQPSYVAYGNGMATTRTYDPAQLYRLTRLVTEFVGGTGGIGPEIEALLAQEALWAQESGEIPGPISSTTIEELIELMVSATTTPEVATEESTTTNEVAAKLTEEIATATTTASHATSTEPIAEETQEESQKLKLKATVKNISSGDLRVEIGTDESSNFPMALLSRWGETSFAISPKLGSTSLTLASDTGEKTVWRDEKTQVRFYELPTTTSLPDGGLEMDVVFAEKPASNIVAFDITIDNLDFFHQAPLSEEPLGEGVARCEATQCFDAEGKVVMERPEHIVGSYAAYYKDGVSGNYSRMGGKNYGTGKAFHIYRPLITDSEGNKVWGELTLNEKEGTLNVTVPQQFLDEAEYPVIVDPTFGYSTAGSSLGTTSNAVGSKYSTSTNASISSISQYTKAAAGTVDIGAAIYSDTSGAPNILLSNQTATTSQGTTVGWVTVPVTQLGVVASTSIWLWGASSASRIVYWDSGATDQYNIKAITWPTWPDPIVPGTYFSRKLSIYANYSDVLSTRLQDISYTYDAVGNITQIVDNSSTGAGKTLLFGYDNLYRLTLASTTAASSTPFKQTYSYNSIGNFTNKSDIGAYFYAGTTTSNYANPHAATQIGSTAYTYDENGNVLTRGTNTYTWDYRNQLKQSAVNSATSSYAYDHNGSRVRLTDRGLTTYYPNQYFNQSLTGPATTTSHIYANGMLVATVENVGGTESLHFIHPDHLGSTNVTSDLTANVSAVYDYYPFGQQRIRTIYTPYDEQRRFIGSEYDIDSQLTYMEARYQDRARGRFMSQDPVFRNMGVDPNTSIALQDPQLQNSYSYARNNPILLKDPDGRFVPLVVLGALAFYGGLTAGTDLYQGYTSGNSGQFALGAVGAATSLIPGGAATKGAGQAIYSVYKGVDAAGDLRYVGITSRNPLERFAEHQATEGTGKELLNYQTVQSGLTRTQARIMEQTVIDANGFQRNGGQLLNKINSISPYSNLGQSISNSLSGLASAFSPTNANQAKALQDVISAFLK